MSDIGHNGIRRHEWLRAILYDGDVTRIGQHLALVIYHLTDPSNNTAKVSIRDLERITGWGRTAINDHLAEIEIFILVRFGRGRAKATFELQGVIAEAKDYDYVPSVVARQTDTTADAMADTSVVARETATRTDTTADARVCGAPDGHKNVGQNPVVARHADTTQRSKSPFSILKKGSIYNYNNNIITARAREGFRDAAFEGHALELFDEDIEGLRNSYQALPDLMAELSAVDAAIAKEVDGLPMDGPSRLARMHELLNAANRNSLIQRQAFSDSMKSKMMVASDDCYFEGHKLIVLNGFRAELMALVGGDEVKFQDALDRALPAIDMHVKGAALKKDVLGRFRTQLQWIDHAERATKAKERAYAPRTGSNVQSKIEAPPKMETDADFLAYLRRNEVGRRWIKEKGEQGAVAFYRAQMNAEAKHA